DTTDGTQPEYYGIQIDHGLNGPDPVCADAGAPPPAPPRLPPFRVMVDHLEMSAWPGAAVNVVGPDTDEILCCPVAPPPKPRPGGTKGAHAFFHHNEGGGLGYGVGLTRGDSRTSRATSAG